MAEPTLYLFDGFNLLHAGGFGSPEELRDLLASWVAAQGARGVLVFDGQGSNERHGPLEVTSRHELAPASVLGPRQTGSIAIRLVKPWTACYLRLDHRVRLSPSRRREAPWLLALPQHVRRKKLNES